MNLYTHELSPSEVKALQEGYSELFQVLLRNIIAGYPDNPKRIGEIFAQWTLYDEFGGFLNKKKCGEVLGWEYALRMDYLLREIACFRFLCDWNLGPDKTKEEKEAIDTRFVEITKNEQVRNWFRELHGGCYEYIREFQEKHKDIKSRYFFEEQKPKHIRSTRIWIPYEKDLLLPIGIRVYTYDRKTSYRAEYIFDEKVFLVRYHDCNQGSIDDVSRRIEAELESKEENPFRDMLINTIILHMEEWHPDDFKKRILDRTVKKSQ